jgi:hypothetical protein
MHMEKNQYEIAMEVADQDCETRGMLRGVNLVNEATFCIIGGLYATLDPDWAQTGRGDNHGGATSVYGKGTIYHDVSEAFGLTYHQVRGLVRINDNVSSNVSLRRSRVKAALTRYYNKEEHGDG